MDEPPRKKFKANHQMEQNEQVNLDQIPPEIIINIMEWLNWRNLSSIATFILWVITQCGKKLTIAKQVNKRWSYIVERLLNRSAWVSTLSQNPDLASAITECFDHLDNRLFSRPNVGFLFVSSFYFSELNALHALIRARVPRTGFQLIGCSAVGVIGTHHETHLPNEIEDGQPAVSITLAKLPDVELLAYAVSDREIKESVAKQTALYPPIRNGHKNDSLNDGDFTNGKSNKQRTTQNSLKDELGGKLQSTSAVDWTSFVVLATPARGSHSYVSQLQTARPRSVIVGGFSSGHEGDDMALFLMTGDSSDKFVRRSGVVGLAVGGAIDLNGMSARGCKPLTPVYKVTRGEKNMMMELQRHDGEAPATLVPANLLLDVYDEDETMQNRQIFIGISPRPPATPDPLHPEDTPVDEFTLHAILKITTDYHMIVSYPKIADHYVQLFVLDPQASEQDVSNGLQAFARNQMKNSSSDAILGGLLFQCTARGRDFYNKPNVDSSLFKRTFPHICIAGFFAAGEIGPVAIGGGIINRSSKTLKQTSQTVQATVQGFTSVFGVFSAKPWSRMQIV